MGIDGSRLDHILYNLHLAHKYSSILDIILKYKEGKIYIIKENKTLKIKKGSIVSLFSFDTDVRVTSEGLKYPLKDLNLRFGFSQSISNEAIENMISLYISGGKLFLIVYK